MEFELQVENDINLRVTAEANQGRRGYMEDTLIVACIPANDGSGNSYAYFGLFDGHGGVHAAQYAKKHLMNNVISQTGWSSGGDENIKQAIISGFLKTQSNMRAVLNTWPKTSTGMPSTAGTTATVVFIRNGKIYVGHVGDSGAVLGLRQQDKPYWTAQPITVDHKPDSPDELERITGCGGRVMMKNNVPRVAWRRPRGGRPITYDYIPFLAVARSLGDFWSYVPEEQEYAVSPVPDVHIIDIGYDHKCLVIASDGLWNALQPQDSINTMHYSKKQNDNTSGQCDFINPAVRLVARAFCKWDAKAPHLNSDNISAISIMIDSSHTRNRLGSPVRLSAGGRHTENTNRQYCIMYMSPEDCQNMSKTSPTVVLQSVEARPAERVTSLPTAHSSFQVTSAVGLSTNKNHLLNPHNLSSSLSLPQSTSSNHQSEMDSTKNQNFPNRSKVQIHEILSSSESSEEDIVERTRAMRRGTSARRGVTTKTIASSNVCASSGAKRRRLTLPSAHTGFTQCVAVTQETGQIISESAKPNMLPRPTNMIEPQIHRSQTRGGHSQKNMALTIEAKPSTSILNSVKAKKFSNSTTASMTERRVTRSRPSESVTPNTALAVIPSTPNSKPAKTSTKTFLSTTNQTQRETTKSTQDFSQNVEDLTLHTEPVMLKLTKAKKLSKPIKITEQRRTRQTEKFPPNVGQETKSVISNSAKIKLSDPVNMTEYGLASTTPTRTRSSRSFTPTVANVALTLEPRPVIVMSVKAKALSKLAKTAEEEKTQNQSLRSLTSSKEVEAICETEPIILKSAKAKTRKLSKLAKTKTTKRRTTKSGNTSAPNATVSQKAKAKPLALKSTKTRTFSNLATEKQEKTTASLTWTQSEDLTSETNPVISKSVKAKAKKLSKLAKINEGRITKSSRTSPRNVAGTSKTKPKSTISKSSKTKKMSQPIPVPINTTEYGLATSTESFIYPAPILETEPVILKSTKSKKLSKHTKLAERQASKLSRSSAPSLSAISQTKSTIRKSAKTKKLSKSYMGKHRLISSNASFTQNVALALEIESITLKSSKTKSFLRLTTAEKNISSLTSVRKAKRSISKSAKAKKLPTLAKISERQITEVSSTSVPDSSATSVPKPSTARSTKTKKSKSKLTKRKRRLTRPKQDLDVAEETDLDISKSTNTNTNSLTPTRTTGSGRTRSSSKLAQDILAALDIKPTKSKTKATSNFDNNQNFD